MTDDITTIEIAEKVKFANKSLGLAKVTISLNNTLFLELYHDGTFKAFNMATGVQTIFDKVKFETIRHY
jgi:hypothetical protein